MKTLSLLLAAAALGLGACDDDPPAGDRGPEPMVAPKPIAAEGEVAPGDLDTRDMELPAARPAGELGAPVEAADAGVIRGQAHVPARGTIEPTDRR
jgi:hypothetical protein